MSGRNWIPAPRLRGDKLRGNDVTFERLKSTCLEISNWN